MILVLQKAQFSSKSCQFSAVGYLRRTAMARPTKSPEHFYLLTFPEKTHWNIYGYGDMNEEQCLIITPCGLSHNPVLHFPNVIPMTQLSLCFIFFLSPHCLSHFWSVSHCPKLYMPVHYIFPFPHSVSHF